MATLREKDALRGVLVHFVVYPIGWQRGETFDIPEENINFVASMTYTAIVDLNRQMMLDFGHDDE